MVEKFNIIEIISGVAPQPEGDIMPLELCYNFLVVRWGAGALPSGRHFYFKVVFWGTC